MSFAEKGAVADIDPAFFVGYLHRAKATGTLKFEDAPIQRAIYFRDGRILFSSSNAPEDQLGAILVVGGKISRQQFEVLVAGLQPKQSLAAALAHGGHVSQRDIGEAARRKVEQIVGACCAQTTGRYEFEDGVLPKAALDLKLTTEKVLISAFEALEPSGFLLRILKSPMAVLAQADAEPADPDLARLRATLDGVSSLADTGGKAGLSPAATEVRAAVLVVLGAAEVVTSQIEEMALPDIGEDTAGSPEPSLPEEAETIAFGQNPAELSSNLSADATLAMDVSEQATLSESSDATLRMDVSMDISDDDLLLPEPGEATPVGGSGLDRSLSPPPRSGAPGGYRGAGQKEITNEGLAAARELIAAPPTQLRLPGAPVPARAWEPMLLAPSRTHRPRKGLAALVQNPLLRRGVALTLLLVVALVGWVAYTSQSVHPEPTATTSVVPIPVPGPPTTASSAAPPSGVQPSPLAAPPSAVTPPSPSGSETPAPTTPRPPAGNPGPAIPAVASPLPAASALPITTPIQATPPKAAPAQTPAPTPPAVVRVTPPLTATPVPPSTKGSPSAVASSSSAYEAMKAGRLAEAASAFEGIARSRSAEFSVQILVACSAQTIAKAIQNDPSTDLYILPATIASKPCHRIMRGFFRTDGEAIRAVAALPGYYTAEGARPRAVSVTSALR